MWLILASLAAAPPMVAWAVEVEGKAVVSSNGVRRALPVWAPIFEGEEVVGAARLRMSDGRLVSIAREKPWRAPATPIHPALTEAWSYCARAWEHRRDSVKPSLGLRAALPSGPVLGGRIGFWWAGAEDRAVELEVMEVPIGTSQWKQAGFVGGHAVYPGIAPKLWPGKSYRWRVRVAEAGTAEAEFSVVETSEAGPVIAAVNGVDEVADLGDEERWILRSAAFQARGLFMDGLEELRRLETPMPPLAEALRRRAWASSR